MTLRIREIGAVVVLALVAGCHGSDQSGSTSTSSGGGSPPSLPNGLTTDAGALFGLDTTQPDIDIKIADTSASLRGHLTSSGGMRQILFAASGQDYREVAASGWNLPPTAVIDATGKALICWNRLVGAEPSPGKMPHPTGGVALICKATSGSAFGPELRIGDDAPSWLVKVSFDVDGAWNVTYRRDQAGWFVGDARPGDGTYQQHFDGKSLGQPTLMKATPVP